MGRATTALGGVAALLLCAGLARAEASDCGAREERVSIRPPPALEYRPHPDLPGGYDRVLRAVPPRVRLESDRSRPSDAWPLAVYVDAWPRRPGRPGRPRR